MSSFGVFIDSIYILSIILNPIHSLFSAFYLKMSFIFLFMKLTHIQVFKKRMHEARIKCFCLQADTLFFLLDVLYGQIFI